MAPRLGMCIGSVNGTKCAHGNNGGPAPAVIIEDGRRMCADHRRGYRMAKTVAEQGSSGRTKSGKSLSIGVRCIGNVNGDPCTHDHGHPAWAVVKFDGRAMCAHHRRGYRAKLTNSGAGWVSQVPKGARVLYAIVVKSGRPMVKIGKAMTSTLSTRANAARLSARELGLSTLPAATVVIRDRPERGAAGPLSLSYEHAVRLVVATALGGRLGAHKTEWVKVPKQVFSTVNWQVLLEQAVAWVDHYLLPVEGAGCDLLRRTVHMRKAVRSKGAGPNPSLQRTRVARR